MTDERRPGGPPPLPTAEPADSDTPTEPPPPMARASSPIGTRVPARLGRTLQPGALTTADVAAEVRQRKATVKIRKSSLPSPSQVSSPSGERASSPTQMRAISAPAVMAPLASTPMPRTPTPTMAGRQSKTRASTPPPLRGPSRTPSTPPRPALAGRPGSVPPPPPTSHIVDAAIQARLSALESELREMKRQPSAAPEGANVARRLTRVESRLAVIEEAFTPSFRTLPSRLNAIETTISARVDQVMSAVGRMEVLSAQLEESEEELGERLNILQARGEGLERRFKESLESASSGSTDEWREELMSLREEITKRWSEANATQPWRDELEALRETWSAVKAEATPDLTGLEALKEEVAALKAEPSTEGLKSRVDALEAVSAAAEQSEAPWRGEIAAIQDTLSALKSADTPDLTELDALREEVRLLKENASTESLEARIKALEAMPLATVGNALTSVKGIGPKYAKALNASGVTGLADIATWSDEDILRIADEVGASEKKVRAWRTSAKAL